jgi:hypothetical protein
LPDQVRTLYTTKTQNAKTGPVRLATYRTQGSCPTDCPLFNAGCYAENRGVGGSSSPFGHAERGTIIGTDYTPLVEVIHRLGPGAMVRLNVSGDYLLPDGTPDHAYIEATNTAHRLQVLSYTHAWDRLKPEWFHRNTRPNASCDTLVDLVNAQAAGWPTVLLNPDATFAQGDTLPGGSRAVVCPYEATGRQCIDCGLCARTQRPSTVLFALHGARRKVATAAINALVIPQEHAA